MNPLSGTDATEYVDGIVHADTQVAERGLDLTVAEVHRLLGRGALDFGGSEFQAADSERLDPQLADEEDTYGWWALPEGTYRVRYNESLRLPEHLEAVLEPLPRLLAAGAHHPSIHPDHPSGSAGQLEMVIAVGHSGCRIKENARVSRLRLREI